MRLASRPPLARIAAIDQAIRGGSWPNATCLAKQLEVSPRTVQRDFIFLRDRLRAPLMFDATHNGYCYTQPDYRLPFFRLTEGELIALFIAERLLRHYRGTPYEVDLRRAFAKITELLPDAVSIDLSALSDTLSVTPTALTPQDLVTFRALTEAVAQRHRLEMEYWTAERNEVTRREVDPLHVTIIEGDCYLVGYCHLRKDVRMFSTARVRSVRPTGDTFARPADFRIQEYLRGSFRAVRGDRLYRVALRFSPAFAGRLAEKVWHSSQTSERTPDGSLVVRVEVTDLREVKRWALFWGSDCHVLEPPELREQVIEEYRKALANYR